jgi:hypothetical protein
MLLILSPNDVVLNFFFFSIIPNKFVLQVVSDILMMSDANTAICKRRQLHFYNESIKIASTVALKRGINLRIEKKHSKLDLYALIFPVVSWLLF